MPGLPMAAPPMPAKVLKYEPSKKKLEAKEKIKPFGWKRVIIDRNGLGDGKPSNMVVDQGMRKLDANWKDVKVIWVDINEHDAFTYEEIAAAFPAKAPKITAIVDAGKAAVNAKKSFFSGDKLQNLSIMISRMPDADTIIMAVEKLKTLSFNAEKIGMMLKQWPGEEMEDLLE